MKKILLSAILILSMVAFTAPSFAFLDDNSVDNSTNANATVGSVGATAVSSPSVSNVNFSPTTIAPDEATVNTNAKGYRGFPNGIQMTYPGMPVYLNGPTDGPSVTDLEVFLMYGNVFDTATLNAMRQDASLKVTTSAECPKVEVATETVKALMKKQVNGKFKRVATITVKAKNLDTTSEKLLAAAALEAASFGATEIHVVDAGKLRVMKGSGWGIGFYYYAAGISASESSGQMGGGGTGYSTGESGYQDKPWIKVIAVIAAE